MASQRVQKIKFNGLDFVLPDGHSDSPIVSVMAFRKGKLSYAHLYDDGRIVQLGKQIGTIEDIIFGEFIDVEVAKVMFMDGLLGCSWLL